MTNSPIYLLIPTLATRDLIEQTLDSLKGKIDLFDKLIISVNGLSSNSLDLLVRNKSLTQFCETHVFCTGKILTLINHYKFILSKLNKFTCKNTLLYFLADDDLITSKAALIDYLGQIREGDATKNIGMGNFQSFSEDSCNTIDEQQHISPGERISPLNFLELNKSGHRYTNISSMIVPYVVFKEATDFMQLLNSAGRRTEYIWASHKQIDYLYSPLAPSVLIRHHPKQEGRILSHVSGLQDELIFVLWVWLNQPLTRPWIHGSRDYGFIFAYLKALVLQLIKLKARRHLQQIFNKNIQSAYGSQPPT